MTDTTTMVRTHIAVNDHPFALAQGQDLGGIKDQITRGVHENGGFVEFTVVGNREVSVLVTPATSIVISVETVQFDPRDTGDQSAPYGGMFDY